MIWFTWRQFRTQTWITVGALAALGVVLVITGRSIADAYAAANVAACGNDCPTVIDNFLRQVQASTPQAVYDLASGLMYVGARLDRHLLGRAADRRELETGTHRLAWNQSVTRTRWLATKLGIVGGGGGGNRGAAQLGGHHLGATGSTTPPATGSPGAVRRPRHRPDRLRHLFAFILGVTLGMLIRRTVPAWPPRSPSTAPSPYRCRNGSGHTWFRQPRHQPAGHVHPGVTIWDHEAGEMKVVGSDNCPMPGSCPTKPSPTPASRSRPWTRNTAGPPHRTKLARNGSAASACARTSSTTPPTTSGPCNGSKPRHPPRPRHSAHRLLLLVDPPAADLNGHKARALVASGRAPARRRGVR